MLISQCQSRTEKEKVIANEEKGRQGPEKDAHLNTTSLMCRLSPTVSAIKDHVVFCWTPPSPIVVCHAVRHLRAEKS